MFGFAVGPLHANNFRFDESYRINPQYDFMVQQAQKHMSPNFRFGRLRVLYMQTRQYDPLAEDVVEQLNALAYSIQNAKDGQALREGVLDYRALVTAHLANLRVTLLALSLSKQDSRFGNPTFFAWMRDGLIQDVLDSGDGLSFDGAYDVITTSEEIVLLGRLGLRLLKTDSKREGYSYFNVHHVEDLRDGRRWFLFVNTTRPIRFLNDRQAQEDSNVFSLLPE